VQSLVGEIDLPKKTSGQAFALSNIALCKYWGKRNAELNLPINSSLSVSLGHLGTKTIISQNDSVDEIFLNGEQLDPSVKFAARLKNYLDLFRPLNFFFKIDTKNNFPTAAGLASSASGYAATAMALNDFFGWRLDGKKLSILARLGSGSASRSVYNGFVEWFRGESKDGLDSFAEQMPQTWPELRLAVVTVSSASKPIGSTEGMKKTVETSTLYKAWPEKAKRDIELIHQAIQQKDFQQLGATAESNALAMHATMIDTQPSVLYWLPETVATFHKIWQLRQDGVHLYFTIDAGPNVKILFLEKDEAIVKEEFSAEIIKPFD
jgi:diphosphomevalonate decarboxylase